MKKKTRTWIYSIISIGLSLLLVNACEKEDINPTNGKTTAVFNDSKTYGTMTDQDGNVYRTITIGDQTWMAENLRTTKYRDGSAIPEIVRSESWTSLTEGAYCNYSNAKGVDTIATYGRLYNWYAVNDSRNLAPAGWHIPSDTELFQLTDYLGGLSVAGGKLKETGTLHWKNPNEAATNETGFTALPDGSRNYGGPFMDKGNYGYMWSTTETADGFAWYRAWSYDHSAVSRGNYHKRQGFSVRCVKDRLYPIQ